MTTDPKQPSTILIVDDDPSNLLLLSSKPLQEAGYKVLQAPGSSEALQTLCRTAQAASISFSPISSFRRPDSSSQ